MLKTVFPNPSEISRRWRLIDASGQILGRLASQVAGLLRGKGKVLFTPQMDAGDFVVVINAGQVRLTGKKREQKFAFHHTKYPGGVRLVPYRRLMAEHPEEAVRRAVMGMLSKSKLRDRMSARLKVYPGPDHPHGANLSPAAPGSGLRAPSAIRDLTEPSDQSSEQSH